MNFRANHIRIEIMEVSMGFKVKILNMAFLFSRIKRKTLLYQAIQPSLILELKL